MDREWSEIGVSMVKDGWQIFYFFSDSLIATCLMRHQADRSCTKVACVLRERSVSSADVCVFRPFLESL